MVDWMVGWAEASRDESKENGTLEYWYCVCQRGYIFTGCTKEDAELERADYYGVPNIDG